MIGAEFEGLSVVIDGVVEFADAFEDQDEVVAGVIRGGALLCPGLVFGGDLLGADLAQQQERGEHQQPDGVEEVPVHGEVFDGGVGLNRPYPPGTSAKPHDPKATLYYLPVR